MPRKPTRQQGPGVARKRQPAKALQAGVPKLEPEKAPSPARPEGEVRSQAPQPPSRALVPPVLSPQQHGLVAQRLREWAASEPDPQVAERLNSVASLNQAFSKPSPRDKPEGLPSASVPTGKPQADLNQAPPSLNTNPV